MVENATILEEIMACAKYMPQIDRFGDYLYWHAGPSRMAKISLPLSQGQKVYGIKAEIVDKNAGTIDSVFFPFERYFELKMCCENAKQWYQELDGGQWKFQKYGEEYAHVMPTKSEFRNIAEAILKYAQMFE